jgi:hypothetical protein
MTYQIFPTVLFVFFSFLFKDISPNDIKKNNPIYHSENKNVTAVSAEEVAYNNLQTNDLAMPSREGFIEALKGFTKLKEKGLITKNILTLIDFSMSSNTKRLWVIDLNSNVVLFNSLVAHGRNTGEEFANSFSNASQSFKSSLGFYATGEIYRGKHGNSLKLDGLENGINSNARERAVVIHGADYVSDSFIQNNKRLGRSLGCPAIPMALTDKIISIIKDKSCLFIYYPSSSYKVASRLIS